LPGEEAESELSELEAQQKLLEEMSRRLMDEGMAAIVLDEVHPVLTGQAA